MGLCLGFSGLSVIEVIYFLTLRAWYRTKNNRQAFKRRITKKIGNPGSAKTKNNRFPRSETATDLLSNEHISFVPVYDPPSQNNSADLSKDLKQDQPLQMFQRKKSKSPHVNHILYTVAFASDRLHDTCNEYNEQEQGH
jgi:hypothetical protein